ncbi:hypothetical protein [Metapseudomonas otitidis]|uniref:hypothetical protein n=1 Tax=Metapseudomonas otitidis TaxID=319939 RepID=UPI001113D30A|nr:hypothetical protein [Pseudomonas otitidis]
MGVVEVCLDALEIRNWISEKLMLIRSDISKEAFSDISHYMTHGEYEMAFEYLLLEVMDLKLNEKFIDGEVVEIAVCLGLDRDYHYDENFWQRLSSIWGRILYKVAES